MKKVIYFIVFMLFFASAAYAAQPFDIWLQGVKEEARAKGISEHVINRAFRDIKPRERIIELDRKQPEGRLTFAEYKRRVISQQRIDQGRAMMRKHRALLEQVSARYSVQPHYIVALWGVETSYGGNTGGFSVIEALATLAHDGRRADFFRAELMHALQILEEGHINHDDMKGSWAGAMGQNQFMPSSFFNFAVDGNDDGKRDIWTSLPDVFASTANYLASSGWKSDEIWGRRVKLTQDIPESITGLDNSRPLSAWRSMGIRTEQGEPIPVVDGMKASLVRPDGAEGDQFLVYDNYRVIMRWNKSTYFASSVGLLADLIAKPAP